MLVIRFLRVGKKNQPVFKIVVTDKRNPPKGGRFVEQVGFYNPLTKEKTLKGERVKYWLSVGAQPSDTVHNLLVSEKVIEGKKIPLHKKKKSSSASTSAPASAEAPADAKALADKSAGKEKPKIEKSSTTAAETPADKKTEKNEEKKEVKKD